MLYLKRLGKTPLQEKSLVRLLRNVIPIPRGMKLCELSPFQSMSPHEDCFNRGQACFEDFRWFVVISHAMMLPSADSTLT